MFFRSKSHFQAIVEIRGIGYNNGRNKISAHIINKNGGIL